MNMLKKYIKWIILVLLLLGFSTIAMLIVIDKISIFDSYIYKNISKLINPTMTSIVKVITNFANPIFLVSFMIVFSYIVGVVKKDRKTSIFFCLNLCIMALVNYILKNIFLRTRPEFINIITEKGYSFPSGHSSVSLVFYGYLIYLINTRLNNKNIKIVSTTLLSILIVLIGLSRVYLGVHYISDVIAGFLIGGSYLILYTHFTDRDRNNWKNNI